VEGACTLVYMFMQWLRLAYEDHDFATRMIADALSRSNQDGHTASS
jgi:hypothetical protein